MSQEVKLEHKKEIKLEYEPDVKLETKPNIKTESEKPIIKPDCKPNVKSEPGSSCKHEPGVKTEGEKSEDEMETSEDEEVESCDCWRCNGMADRIEFGYQEPEDVGHLIINLGHKRMKFEKNPNGGYTCPEESCNYTAIESNRMRMHYMKHTGEKKYQCKLCDKKFAKIETCRNHIRTHDDKYKFKCSECDKTFAQFPRMKKHSLDKHGLMLESRTRQWGFWAREDDFW